jgi:signal peptidase II
MSVLATAAIATLLLFLARVRVLHRTVVIGFGLIIGGGLGNLVDRVRLGYVTDFILHGNSAFNLADVAILTGTMLILVGLVATFLRPQLRSTST